MYPLTTSNRARPSILFVCPAAYITTYTHSGRDKGAPKAAHDLRTYASCLFRTTYKNACRICEDRLLFSLSDLLNAVTVLLSLQDKRPGTGFHLVIYEILVQVFCCPAGSVPQICAFLNR